MSHTAWQTLTSRSYEFFVVQHICTALLLLISLLAHLQVDLKQGINYYYASAAPWGVSVIVRLALFIWSHFKGEAAMMASLEPLAGEVTRLRIAVPKTLTWQAGQHVYLRLYGSHLLVSALLFTVWADRLTCSKYTHSQSRPPHQSTGPTTTS